VFCVFALSHSCSLSLSASPYLRGDSLGMCMQGTQGGITALSMARFSNHAEIVQLLLDAGADKNATSSDDMVRKKRKKSKLREDRTLSISL